MKKEALRKPKSLRLNKDTPATSMTKNSIALGISTAMLMPLTSMAQTATPPATEATLPTVVVQSTAIDPNPNAEVGVPYKAKTSGDSRHTRPLAETPQTISVITKTAIDDSGQTDLKQILATQPGITLGTGENGNAFGDRYIIRGQEARSDVFVDGLRDPGMSTRESFAIEQLEISKGPNSSFAGRGTAGGAINAITKQATTDIDFTRFSLGLGTDSHVRATADANKVFTDQFALRVNALYGKEDVPDRSPSQRNRKGLALSGLWEVNPDLSLTLDYYGLRAKDDFPDLGSFLVGTVPNRVPARNVPVYAQANDFLESDTDTLTARVKYRFAPNLNLTSLTRYGTASNAYATTGASSQTRFNGATSYTTGALDGGHTGWQEVDYLAHQSNLRWDTNLFGKKNEFIFGVEYTDHKVVSGNYAVTSNGAPNCTTAAGAGSYCFTDANGNPVADLANLSGRTYSRLGPVQDWHVKTFSLSAMDTIDLTDKFTAFGGLRADNFDLKLLRFSGPTAGNYGYNDTLVNGHFGLSYKINPMGMVYASYATAQDINGGEADAGTSSGYGGAVLYRGSIAGAKPETSQNVEVGTKWNLFDDKALLTAAIFQTKKTDVMEGADYDAIGTFNTGSNRVRGIEFGLTGNLTDKLTVQAGAAFMKSRVLKSANPINVGNPLSNFADRSASVQAKYQFTNAFSFGGIARYESSRCGGQPDTGAGFNTQGQCLQPVPSFTVYDLFGSYRINKKADLRLNILNVTDKDYYTAVYRSGAFLYKGDGRAIRLTLNYEM
ncbi:catecholate siderophore receptor [Paucimonas lemoignei]|uniref:Catecholate siderophore receptor n=2 Tax=Paucimonas lemoignei TaxID=29443 RepID=A0A4R3HSG0_PAULE|nr:catecholate siderophore receptor [Paucimonas lemoignei]